MKKPIIQGRGAQINPPNRFENLSYDTNPIDWALGEDRNDLSTTYQEVHPKTIINKVISPDIPLDFSMNPYQGCEHGCVYCYARPSHNYWGYSSGTDFEQKILYKSKAAHLLAKQLKSKKWKAAPIMLSGNTDCYQPVEQKLELTREILKIFWRYRHPVGIITKNSLILRDLDLLKKLAKHRLVKVVISVTTLDEQLRIRLEPRTATAKQKLKTIETLHKHQIPVMTMMAPIIPGLNEHEIFDIAKASSERGAYNLSHTLVRLNGDLPQIFTNWLQQHYPDKAQKVLNKIQSIHNGQFGSSQFGERMTGAGNIATIIHQQIILARKKYFQSAKVPEFNLDLHEQFKSDQLKLF